MKGLLRTSVIAVLLLGAVRMPARAGEDASAPVVLINYLDDGAKLEGLPVCFCVELKNIPPGRHVVEAACGVYTHYFLIDPEDPWIGGGGWYEIFDHYFLPGKGPNRLTVTVKGEDEKTIVAEGSVSFALGELSDEKKVEGLAEVRSKIISAALNLERKRNSYKEAFTASKNQKDYNSYLLETAAEDYLSGRNRDLIDRIGAFAALADFYDRSFRPGEALGALQHAEEIYEEEKGLKTSAAPAGELPIVDWPGSCAWAPDHLEGYAKFYARRMALERAAGWLEKAAAFYEDQATRRGGSDESITRDAKFHAACIYRKIAQYHFMLDKDMAAYETWMGRFMRTLPKEKAVLASADWHGIIRGRYR